MLINGQVKFRMQFSLHLQFLLQKYLTYVKDELYYLLLTMLMFVFDPLQEFPMAKHQSLLRQESMAFIRKELLLIQIVIFVFLKSNHTSQKYR